LPIDDISGMMETMAESRAIRSPRRQSRRHHRYPAQQRDNALQWAAPSAAFGRGEAAPQRIDLGQGKARTIAGMASASTSAVWRPGFAITANQAVAIFQLVLRQTGLAEETFQRLRRRRCLRPLELLADGTRLQAADLGRSKPGGAAWQEVTMLGRLQTGLAELARQTAGPDRPRLVLHPRGDFLAAEFEQEVASREGWGRVPPGSPFLSIHAWHLPAASLGEIADPAHVAGAFLHGDHAARLQQVEQVACLDRLVIGRKRHVRVDAALAFRLRLGEALKRLAVSATSKL
jgi:hypothetical protein